METGRISSSQAATALDAIEESRSLVRPRRRGNRIERTTRIVTPLVVYGAKDFIPDRRVRWPVTLGWRVASIALAVGRHRTRRVQPRSPGIPQPSKSKTMAALVVMVGMLGLQLLIVHLLRSTRLRRPNLVAGVVLAGLTWAFQSVVLPRLMADVAGPEEAEAELHPALRAPESLRLAALLDAASLDPAVAAEWLGLTADELAELMRPLVEENLASSTQLLGAKRITLTMRGRVAFAKHVRALRELSTGDSADA